MGAGAKRSPSHRPTHVYRELDNEKKRWSRLATVCCVGVGACSPNHAIPNKPRPAPWGLLPYPAHVAQQRMVAGPQGMGCLGAVGGGWGRLAWPGLASWPHLKASVFVCPGSGFVNFCPPPILICQPLFSFAAANKTPFSLSGVVREGHASCNLNSGRCRVAKHRMSAALVAEQQLSTGRRVWNAFSFQWWHSPFFAGRHLASEPQPELVCDAPLGHPRPCPCHGPWDVATGQGHRVCLTMFVLVCFVRAFLFVFEKKEAIS